jgi:hypothetical protein
LTFVLGDAQTSVGGVARIKVESFLESRPYRSFWIDLSTELHLVTGIERLQPSPLIELPGADPLPTFALQPLPNQVADKVCGIYERPPTSPSTRYRDLVDLVLITTHFTLDAHLTRTALISEAQRRGFTLPEQLDPPGPSWATSYRAEASRWGLPEQLRQLTNALHRVGACLEPLLTGQISTGTWMPQEGHWAD